jgi:anti-anti-sigma factor
MRSRPTELKVDVEQLENGPCIVSIAGEIDIYTAPELDGVLLGIAENGATCLVVDLTDCSFVDSTALRVLADASRRPESSGKPLMLVSVDPAVRRVFEITGFDRVYPIYASRAEALAAGDRRPAATHALADESAEP